MDCLQSSPWFRAAYPVVLWDRELAATAIAMMAACHHEDGAATAIAMRVARHHEDGADCSIPEATSVNPAVESVTSAQAGQWIGGRHRKQPT